MVILRIGSSFRTALVGFVLVSFAFFAVACGGSSLSAAERNELKAELVAEGMSEREADCFIKELGGDAKRIWQSDDDEMSESDFAKLFGAFIKCAEE